ncbi:MAG TPA: acetyl-CoA hydrolase/transferase C-terminal domain-containing protein [Syntrophomonadaceae bacterium]|nr:acetyl-CoA hydrolase/transferase C-terminal domain-containing protein [Syntrophomonadaceae bacterium]
MSTLMEEYKSKLITAEKAAQLVKSGSKVAYGTFLAKPIDFDAALADRAIAEGLTDIAISSAGTIPPVPQVILKDMEQKHFQYYSGYYTVVERKLADMGAVNFIPFSYHETVDYRSAPAWHESCERNIGVMQVCPMDKAGNFNFGIANSFNYADMRTTDICIVEINENMPYCLGGAEKSINIKDVDYIIEGSNEPVFAMPESPEPSETEKQIAKNIMPFIEDGSCIQLGIGGIPNAIGLMIAQSDLKDLGINSEMFVDSFVDMYEAGRITNKYKTRDKGRSTYTFCFATQKTYDFMANNPLLASYNAKYTNDPKYVQMEDKVVAVNNIVEIDLLSQVASETNGLRQISGTGGQLDFTIGAYESKGGKGILAFESTFTKKDGTVVSRIKPMLTPGSAVTVPRTCVHYVATEHGIALLKGRSVWSRTEQLINLAAPEFRDELIREAQEMKIWTRTNKTALL